MPIELDRVALITETPWQVSPLVLAQIDTLAVVGDRPQRTIAEFCEATGRSSPLLPDLPLSSGEIIFWRFDSAGGPIRMHVKPPDKRPAAAERRIVEEHVRLPTAPTAVNRKGTTSREIETSR